MNKPNQTNTQIQRAEQGLPEGEGISCMVMDGNSGFGSEQPPPLQKRNKMLYTQNFCNVTN